MLRLLPLLAVLLALPSSAVAAVGAHTGQSKDDVLRYWTDARMKAAKPRDKAKPGGGPGGGSGVRSYEPAVYPKQHGKVFFSDGGSNWVCSGTAVAGASRSIVWTAGHCSWSDSGTGPVTNFMFVPAFKDGAAPYGHFAATDIFSSTGWKTVQEFGVDFGAARVATNESGQTLAAAVGGRTILFAAPRQIAYHLIGYPAAGKFNGQRMRICDTSWLRDDTSTTPDAIGVGCDMTGGSSGGGWLNDSNLLVSNVSYGYGNLKNVLFGPHLEGDAQSVYAAAAG
jgi:V8-like Glu-specific endopeptidase